MSIVAKLPRGGLKLGPSLGLEDDLGQSLAIADVNEREPAEVGRRPPSR